MAGALIAIDQGTTSTRAIVFDAALTPLASAQIELPQIYPEPGWVEHDPEEIWTATVQTVRDALAKAQGLLQEGFRLFHRMCVEHRVRQPDRPILDGRRWLIARIAVHHLEHPAMRVAELQADAACGVTGQRVRRGDQDGTGGLRLRLHGVQRLAAARAQRDLSDLRHVAALVAATERAEGA